MKVFAILLALIMLAAGCSAPLSRRTVCDYKVGQLTFRGIASDHSQDTTRYYKGTDRWRSSAGALRADKGAVRPAGAFRRQLRTVMPAAHRHRPGRYGVLLRVHIRPY